MYQNPRESVTEGQIRAVSSRVFERLPDVIKHLTLDSARRLTDNPELIGAILRRGFHNPRRLWDIPLTSSGPGHVSGSAFECMLGATSQMIMTWMLTEKYVPATYKHLEFFRNRYLALLPCDTTLVALGTVQQGSTTGARILVPVIGARTYDTSPEISWIADPGVSEGWGTDNSKVLFLASEVVFQRQFVSTE